MASAAASTAWADWSIILVDTRTGEVAVGCATCATGLDPRAGIPMVLPELGAGIVRYDADLYLQNRTFMRDRILEGIEPSMIVSQLALFESRLNNFSQYGIVDVLGRGATSFGSSATQWRGGQVDSFENSYAGQTGTVWYAIQGVALAGEPVLLEAVEAAISTPGDLSEKLMISMEAARAFGGDGRCSCSTSNPTQCGAPPPSFTKSAHQASMLIARAGDVRLSTGSYRLAGDPAWISVGDVNGDDRPDLAAATQASVSVVLNTTVAGSPVPTFASLPITLSPGSALYRWAGIADVTGDGLPDILGANNQSHVLSVWPGAGNGTFGTRVDSPVQNSPWGAVIADFDGQSGPDVAVTSDLGYVSVLLNNGAGGFARTDVVAGGRSIAIGDFDGDGDVDLVTGTFSGGGAPTGVHVRILRNEGTGAFTDGGVVQIAPSGTIIPVGIEALDFDDDGDVDVVVAASTTLHVLTNSGTVPPTFAVGEITLPRAAAGLTVGDVDNDGIDDVYVSAASLTATVVRGTPAGLVVVESYSHRGGTSVGSLKSPALADFDGDGDLDAAIGYAATFGNSAHIVPNLGADDNYRFLDGGGLIPPDAFMNFNVALQAVSDPDPVLQLRQRFDPWRSALVGRPDAVQSLVRVPAHMAAGDPAPRTMTISLRDWQGVPITAPVLTPVVTLMPGSPGATNVGAVKDLGGGVYGVELTATGVVGTDRYEIQVDDGVRPVILMPRTNVPVVACPSDINGDGVANSTDISDFINQWFKDQIAGTLVSDFNGDGVVNSTDVSDLINAWFVDLDAGLCV